MDLQIYALLKRKIEESTYDDTELRQKLLKVIEDVNVINGNGEGSISKAVADEIAKVIAGAPESFDTLKELSDWINTHSESAAAMNNRIAQNENSIDELKQDLGDLKKSYFESEINNFSIMKEEPFLPTLDIGAWGDTEYPVYGAYPKTITTLYHQSITGNENIAIYIPENWVASLLYMKKLDGEDKLQRVAKLNFYNNERIIYPNIEANKNNISGYGFYAVNIVRYTENGIDISKDITESELTYVRENFKIYGYIDTLKCLMNNEYGYSKTIKFNGIIAEESNPNFGSTFDSSLVNSIDFVKIPYGYNKVTMKRPYYTNETSFGTVFYDADKNPINGYVLNISDELSTELIDFIIPSEAKYFRTVWWNSEDIAGQFEYHYERVDFKEEVYVAASNSSEKDKSMADYICNGTNDELIIQKAIDECNGEVVLLEGKYYIDSFPHDCGNNIHTAILTGRNSQQNIIIRGAGFGSSRKYGTDNQFTQGAILCIKKTTYDNISSSDVYSIIGAKTTDEGYRIYPYSKVMVKNIAFVLPDNQKPIICIDGWYMSSLSINNIYAMAVANPYYLKIPVENCIAVRGLQGSNFGINNKWEHSFVWGFYEGFAVSGEHLLGIDLGARFCNYGFTFNRKKNTVGAWIHPITLINCCDECNFNMPVFGDNGESGKNDKKSGRQSINLIDYNLEWLPDYYNKGGNYATELNNGFVFGEISYTIQPSYAGNSKNAVDIPFWADGSGKNVKTRNMAHSLSGTSIERRTYAANFLQTYFDTDIKKLLIYDGENWIDNNGNIID